MSDNDQALPDVGEAYNNLFEGVHANVFFGKLANHGIQPQNEKEAADLLELAGKLRGVDDTEKEARYAAVLAIIGLVDLPIIHFSVEWWRTLHQPQSISMRGVSISSGLLAPLLCMSIGMSLLFSYMLMVRTQLLYLDQLLHAKKGRLLSQFHMSKSNS